MHLLNFTPAKFSLLTVTAVAVTLGASTFSTMQRQSNRFMASDLYRQGDAVGEAAGLTSNLERSSFIPTPVPHLPERRGILLPTPQTPTPIIRRNYPPMER